MTDDVGLGSRRASQPSVRRDCAKCRKLWELIYRASLKEFFWQQTLDADNRLNAPVLTAAQRAAAELAFIAAASVREDLELHRQWHAAGGAIETLP